VENFVFSIPTRLLFGRGMEDRVGEETARYSRRVLLLYGTGSIKKIGLYDKVCRSLGLAGVEFSELGGVVPNPRLGLVQEGIELCRKDRLDMVLAVGGGSVIDSAKSVAIGVPYSGDVWDFFAKKATVEQALPVGVVLTIPAAGSESSTGAVITKEEGLYKWDVVSEILCPKFAILNPEVTYSLSPYQTACGVADIVAHILERYFTPTRSVDLTDRLCEAALRGVIHSAPLVLEHPGDYNCRAEIMWAGTVAHNDTLSSGRVGDWASHMIEHEVSASYDVPHGAGLAVIFPAWMRRVYKHDVGRFAQFAMRVWEVEYDLDDPERTAVEGIRRLSSFFQSIGLATTLEGWGIPGDQLADMARKCTERGPVGTFVKLDRKAVLEIYKLAER
jgi:alcohol dehydrogenase YqhD (iron-dependent ADH family)